METGYPLTINVNVESLRVYSYSLPFKEPLQVGKQILHTRGGFVIKVTDKEGSSGYGEAAPLPGYSTESLAQVKKQLLHLTKHQPQLTVLPGELYPSAAFALETALLQPGINANLYDLYDLSDLSDLSGDQLGDRQKKSKKSRQKIPVNALLHPNRSRLETQIEELLDSGFRTIKIKVGRQDPGDDIDTVNRVSRMLPGGVSLRLDANRLWDFDTAVSFGRAVDSTFIEYVEEPFPDVSRIPAFCSNTGIAVALDESLDSVDPREARIPAGVGAFVLKPAMLGGIRRTLDFMLLAKNRGIKPVISSCFEAGPGFALLLKIAAALDSDSASGLDTLKYLEQNLFKTPLIIEDGFIHCEHVQGKSMDDVLNFNLLTPLDTKGTHR
jgi:O-succinylbenzoate synthase